MTFCTRSFKLKVEIYKTMVLNEVSAVHYYYYY